MFVEFVIQNQLFSYSLENFAQILDVSCEGACVFTDRWRLDELAYGIPSNGPYQTNPPSIEDVILSFRIDQEGQVRRIRHEEEIGVHDYQILTREIIPTLKPLEEIIRENVFCLGGVISDHCPILLKNCHRDSGPRPFRIFDFWANYDDFDELVLSSWCAGTFYGTDDIKLKNKIKSLKAERLINTQKSESLKRQLVEWDQKAESGKLSAIDVENRDEVIIELHKMDQEERDAMKQKSCIKWAIEGDENSRFFHALLKCKGRKKLVNGLICDGVLTDDPTVIKEAIYNHFCNRFKEPRVDRPKFIHESDALLLESSISMEELKRAVDDCSGSKAPGPDGLNFNFRKRYWEILRVDFHKCFAYFEATGRLSRGVNPSFITLVPKIKDTIEISDFRPISLIGCVYKVISKVLASHLAKVINKIISPNQTAFIAGWQILDDALIANEIVNFASKSNLKLLLFKVDFEKAFDSVNWGFLIDIIKQIGFGHKWCLWIIGCLKSASISILVNGSLTKEFQMERGLRQGDPLSPFLFIIVAEALQISILEACGRGIFAGLSLANDGANLSLLQYADDTLFFGLPVGKIMYKKESWSEVLDRFSSRLSSWKSRMLSIGGRLTLSKAVLKSLPLYYLSLFRAPSRANGGGDSTMKKILFGVRLSPVFTAMTMALIWVLVWGIEKVFRKVLWAWRSNPRGRALDEINNLSQLIGSLVLYPGYMDRWIWDLDPGGVFTINKLSKLVDSTILGPNVMMVNVDWNS
ncbi:putative RNA-directed DNA polymerase, eukaryota, reverse transcriptase zinc-binding domain protein [Tanacetum coccineum]